MSTLLTTVGFPRPLAFILLLMSMTMASSIGLLRGDIHFSSRSLRDMSRLAGALSGQDEEHFLEFIQSMLSLEPGERPEARELLNSAWLASGGD